MNIDDFPWPDINDDLSLIGSDWMNNACLNITLDELDIYSEGYKMAANNLSERLQQDRSHIDFLLYPLIFLFRHHIELQLKIIIYDGDTLYDGNGVTLNYHHLDKLWNEAKSVIIKVWPKGPKSDLAAAEKIILQLNSLDPDSMAFRYDRDRQGNKMNPALKHIDIKNFTDVINNLSSFLSGAASGISEYVELKNEHGS